MIANENSLQPPVRTPRILHWLAYAIVGGYLALALFHIATHRARYQWDFRTYYYGSSAYQAGLDPYRLRSLSQVAGREIGFPFVYPPFALILFAPMTALETPVAYILFLVLKVAAFMGLLVVWRKGFLPEGLPPLFLAFLVFGFGGALMADFTAGNVAVFEQLTLWVGFLGLVRRRPGVFCAGVIAASLLKLLPIVFLFLLLLAGTRRNTRWFFAGVAAFAVYLALNATLWPYFMSRFLHGSMGLDSRGIDGPSTLALIRDVGDFLAGRGIPLQPEWLNTLYLLIALGIVGITARAISRGRNESLQSLIYLACLAFAVAAPRMKDYAYVLVLLPAYAVLTAKTLRVDNAIALLLVSLSPRLFLPYQSSAALSNIVWSYAPLLGAVFVWVLQVKTLMGEKGGSTGSHSQGEAE